jgi:biotin synthase
MNDAMRRLVDRLETEGVLEPEEFGELIRFRDSETTEYLNLCAQRVRRRYHTQSIHVMGTIDLTTYCKNDCYYCAFQRQNRFFHRYRMDIQQVLSCCREGLEQGISTFLLQGGEDLEYTGEQIADMISAIKQLAPHGKVMLALGEKSRNVYRLWRDAGASGYILRHEAADESLYRKLHPANMSLLRRKQCLWELKELGYDVGSGFMLGIPYQQIADISREFLFLRQLMPQMVLVGPFLPMEGTRFEGQRNGQADLNHFVLSLLCLMMPQVTLPVAQTLELIDKEGYFHGVRSGANMLMVDLTPENFREQYHTYKRRLIRGDISLHSLEDKKIRLGEEGYEIVVGTGDVR